ncbi:hypothetical protein JG687_00015937 [Phytophthora cactorum]|uniref:START-like domain n=1 Tax=Phytophthora cactorum TaxID=29920 RepID=A0A8T1TVN2_9STRA|nr:hypothetical protein JG687_00015937 [Phytophthora cactorum]
MLLTQLIFRFEWQSTHLPSRWGGMSNKRFTVNPFGDLTLSNEDRSKLLDIVDALVHSKFEEYDEYVNTKKRVDPARWKKFSASGAATTYIERKNSNPDSNLPVSLMVGPLPGTLDEIMFGLVSPTLESMRIKASYLNDFSAAAVLATIVEPTVDEPFQSVVVKWMEIDIPGASIGFVRNRDYVYVESTGILHLANGEHEGPDRTDCRGTGILDPRGDIIRTMALGTPNYGSAEPSSLNPFA